MLCGLCEKPILGKKHRTLYRDGEDLVHTFVCERCWNKHDNVAEAIMAKRKTRKVPEVRPCERCGRTDFETDQARRGHQGHCQGKNPPPKLEKPKLEKPKGVPKPALATPPPPVVDGKPEEEKVGQRQRTKSQVGRGSKQKGNKFENEVKKRLAKWWGEPEDVVGTKSSAFQRAPGSGGTSPTNWPLDLFVPPDFPWAVECKDREGTGGWEEMERFFSADRYNLVEWFRVAEEELVEAKIEKPLLLVFTKNFFPDMVALRRPALTPAGSSQRLFMTLETAHATLCKRPFGEILILTLEDLLARPKGHWIQVYSVADRNSYIPRRWEEKA